MNATNFVLGTAGHIDHGKTSLIKALTGADGDRLAEEKKRGITIDLGFSRMDLGQGLFAAVVDVPGHRQFIHNMLAGASGIDMALFVIAADDSIMPQTVEHMAILDILGVKQGVVALTKADLVDKETLEMALMEVGEFVEKSTLAGARVIACSAATGQGVEEIRQELARLAASARQRPEEGFFRMAVDRAFNMKGHGLVVTGTVISGTVSPEDHLALAPGQMEIRVRRVQTHGQTAAMAQSGSRAALNITGARKEQLQRGMILCHPALRQTCNWFAASLSCHPTSPRKIVHGGQYLLHIHAAETLCRVILAGGRKSLAPGETAIAGIGFEPQIQLLHHDRFVLRSSSAEETLGGGLVLEPGAKPMGSRGLKARMDKWNALATVETGIFAMVDEAPWGYPMEKITAMFNIPGETLAKALSSRAGEYGRFELKGSSYIYNLAEGERVIKALVKQTADFHKKNPALPGMEEQALMAASGLEERMALRWIGEAVARNLLERSGSIIKLPGRDQVFEGKEKLWREKIIQAYRGAGLHNPPKTDHMHQQLGIKPAEAARAIRLLVQSGELVSLAPDHTLHQEALERAKEALLAEITSAGSVETARFRDLLGVGRKAAIDILEHFDRVGLTRRVENKRVLAKP